MRALYHHRTQGRGVEAVHIRGVAHGLEQLGYTVEIVSPPGVHVNADAVESDGERRHGASPWAALAKRVPQILFELMEIDYTAIALPRLLGRCRSGEKPELIYERYALFNAAGALAGELSGVPVVLEVNETAEVDRTRHGKSLKLKWLARWFERKIFRMARAIIVVSSYLKEELVRQGVPAEKILVIPNAVDPERFDPAKAHGAAIRERHGLQGRLVVGFTGGFLKWHGVDFLIRACAGLMQIFPNLRLLLVGDGPRREAAQAQAEALGIADRVIFTGSVPHAEIPSYLAAMDVGVMPASNAHGSPMKVFEYMAMGLPVVAPRYQPLQEAVEDGHTGLLFEPDDVEALSRALFSLLISELRRRSMGAAGRLKVLQKHLWLHNARAVVDYLKRGERRTEVAELPMPPRAITIEQEMAFEQRIFGMPLSGPAMPEPPIGEPIPLPEPGVFATRTTGSAMPVIVEEVVEEAETRAA
jgi:glycosyltransferase involved in cell wall biosynthesis